MKTVAANIDQIFGKLTPPPGPTEIYKDPVEGLSRVLVVGIQLSLIIGAFFSLIYLLMGAIDWVAAGGDKETLQKAQAKMRNAFVGMLVLVFALTLFVLITGNLLNIIQIDGGGFQFILPRF
ncbi:hypothetical protein A2690_03375 [Candidatus Roizmanbacteria bacterium RIFCSPHIGHO2_01_FULL_39_12b]|uniref:Uncharacterized protein n=1 Tax=Candidatus Roizmanbacteria bacterium RIFCSPHIGHO2_01_FULL_39_12b TaxID=1802030 RepID=A0A1F7GCN4_9BACT|nr:MAG: hypothetical protein A2690_03375 [Candidatus Roizmanbacteria bacterium RIFCSPHIGHO2_01_FULL_39_12b]OGK46704.1 MAG: hypothetical protein A3B46_02625 [Candidatus Roizmanbacteria bacterium RIFCSPLOWO2_01_FULL_39_19]